MAIPPAVISGGFKLLGGILGGRSRRREIERQNQLEMEKFVRLRQAAEAGGFHPLEALRAGAEVQATARPGIMSSIAASGALDVLENELTGEGARQRRRQEVDDEIRERELERLKIETARGIIGQATIGGNAPPRIWPQGTKRTHEPGDGFYSPAGLTFGSPVTKDEIEPGTNTITQTGRIGDDVYEDPSQPDMSAFEERDGDFEAQQWWNGAKSILNRWDYNEALEFTAQRTNKTKQEIHDWVASGNPAERRDMLPGIPARIVMSLQEAFAAFGKQHQSKTPDPKYEGPYVGPRFSLGTQFRR